ncbi:uncharacterized protein BROUX77_004561 [Berkeleyomyces rouxiae]|uniref:uncharacterized protein n=1 Tax=Berkeleyomyces rouxiae TaxID=2035830 RepID=UPI003B771C7B
MLGGQSNNPDSSIISASQTTIPTSDCMPGSDDEGNTLDSSIISRHEKPMNQSIYDALLPGNSSPSFKDVISPKVHPGSMNRKSSIQPVAESKVSFIAATPNAMSSNTEGQKSTAPQNAQKAQQSMNATMNLNVGDWGNISNTGSFGMDSISSNSNLVESARYSFSTEMEPIPLSNTTAAADGPNSSFPSGLGSSELLPPGSRQALLYQNMIPISGPETMQAGSLSIPFPVSTHNLTPASQLMAAPETAQESTVTLLIDKSHFEAFIQGDPEATKLVQAKAKAKSEAQNEAKRRQQQRPQIEQPRQSQRSKQVQTSSGLKSRQVSVEPPTAESRPVTQQCNQSPSRSSAGPETPVSRAELTSTGPSSQSFKPSPKSTHISRPPTQPQTIVVNHPQFRGLQYADGQLYDPEGGRASNESQTKAKAKVKAKAETESNNSQTQGQDAQRIQKAKREAQPEQTQSQPQQQAQVQAQFQAQAHAQAQAQRQAQAQAVQAQVQAGAHAQLRAAQEGQLRQTHVGPGIQHPQIIPPPFGQNMPESPWSPSSGLSGNLNPQWPNQQVQPLMTPQQAMQHSGSPIFSPQSSLAHFNQVPSRYAGAARGLHQNSFASQIPTQRPIAHAHMNNLALVNTVMPQAMRQRGGLTRTMSECDGYSEDFQYQPMKRQRGMDIGATTGVPVFNSGHMVPSVDMQSVNFGRRPSGATYVLATGPHSPNRAPMAPHSPASREIENQASKLPAQSPTGPQPPSHSQTQMQQPQTPHCQNQVANANTPARSGSIHNVSSSMTGLQPTTPVTMSGQPGGFGGPVSGGSHNQSGTCFLGSDTMESG